MFTVRQFSLLRLFTICMGVFNWISNNCSNRHSFCLGYIPNLTFLSRGGLNATNWMYFKNELLNSNSVSIHIRRGRFGDEKSFYNGIPDIKNDFFLKKSLEYIFRGIKFFKKKIKNPKFFLWSNNFDGLNQDVIIENKLQSLNVDHVLVLIVSQENWL